MDASMHTTSYDGSRKGTSKTAHQRETAVLEFMNGEGGRMTIFGPESAKDAFDQIAKLFNDAHRNEAPIGDAGVILPATDEALTP